jgi:membrane protease YdiL (CAAX protease family)
MESLSANSGLYYFVSSLTVASFGFIFYYFLSYSERIKKLLKAGDGERSIVLFQRITGVVIFFGAPFLILLIGGTKSIVDFGVIRPVTETYLWTIILSLLIVPINYFNSRTPDNLEMYPQIRANTWSSRLLFVSAISWMAYLVSYEFLFRGFLFFSTLLLIGLWPAIILNTAIYALIHFPKGIKETVGAIPLGIILCYLTYRTGSIWVAVFVHIIMALTNEWFSIRANPEISVKLFRK